MTHFHPKGVDPILTIGHVPLRQETRRSEGCQTSGRFPYFGTGPNYCAHNKESRTRVSPSPRTCVESQPLQAVAQSNPQSLVPLLCSPRNRGVYSGKQAKGLSPNLWNAPPKKMAFSPKNGMVFFKESPSKKEKHRAPQIWQEATTGHPKTDEKQPSRSGKTRETTGHQGGLGFNIRSSSRSFRATDAAYGLA